MKIEVIRGMAKANILATTNCIGVLGRGLHWSGYTVEECCHALYCALEYLQKHAPEHWILPRLKEECEAYRAHHHHGLNAIEFHDLPILSCRFGKGLYTEAALFLYSLALILEERFRKDGNFGYQSSHHCYAVKDGAGDIRQAELLKAIHGIARAHHLCLLFPVTEDLRAEIREDVRTFSDAVNAVVELFEKHIPLDADGFRPPDDQDFWSRICAEQSLIQSSRPLYLQAIDARLREPFERTRRILLTETALFFYRLEVRLETLFKQINAEEIKRG